MAKRIIEKRRIKAGEYSIVRSDGQVFRIRKTSRFSWVYWNDLVECVYHDSASTLKGAIMDIEREWTQAARVKVKGDRMALRRILIRSRKFQDN